jgi:large subunit ribosomal protein L4
MATTLASTSTSNLQPYAPAPIFVTLSHLTPPPVTGVPDEVVQLDQTVFGEQVRRDILHLCVVHHRDGLRQGSANTKNRAEVRGSGAKIRPQKGSGRARLGDGQSPMLRGGGVAFGPKPRDFATELPRKVRALGMRVALSARLKARGLSVVRSLDWPSAKTKGLAQRVAELGWRKTLFVTGLPEVPEGLRRASGNLRALTVVRAEDLDVYSVVRWPRVILDVYAVDHLEQKFGKGQALPLVSEEVLSDMMSSLETEDRVAASISEPAASLLEEAPEDATPSALLKDTTAAQSSTPQPAAST